MEIKSHFTLCLISLIGSALFVVITFVLGVLQYKLFWIPFAFSSIATVISTCFTIFCWQIKIDDKEECKNPTINVNSEKDKG